MGVNKSNFITREVAPNSLFESALDLIDNTVNFEQGDHLALVGGLIVNPTAETDSATYLGISRVTVVNGKIKQPYSTDVDASQAINSVAGPQFGVTALFEARAADTFNPGDLVGLDPANLTRGVSTTVTTNAVGIYQGKTITAVAGDLIEIYLIIPVLAQA